jgi:hypothetical protein
MIGADPSMHDVAWVAGMIDLNGCVCLCIDSRHCVSVAAGTPSVATGGNVRSDTPSSVSQPIVRIDWCMDALWTICAAAPCA